MLSKLQTAAIYLLIKLTKEREQILIQTWRGSDTAEKRETAWLALRELDIFAGAIENETRQHSDD